MDMRGKSGGQPHLQDALAELLVHFGERDDGVEGDAASLLLFEVD